MKAISVKTRKVIDICKEVLEHGPLTVKFLDGQDVIDAQTANMVVQVYNALSPENQVKCDQIMCYKEKLVLLWKCVA